MVQDKINIQELSLVELKALGYDLTVQLETIKSQLKTVNNLIIQNIQKQEELEKEKCKDGE